MWLRATVGRKIGSSSSATTGTPLALRSFRCSRGSTARTSVPALSSRTRFARSSFELGSLTFLQHQRYHLARGLWPQGGQGARTWMRPGDLRSTTLRNRRPLERSPASQAGTYLPSFQHCREPRQGPSNTNRVASNIVVGFGRLWALAEHPVRNLTRSEASVARARRTGG